MESFRTPNFVLVSDVLYWLMQRYDPNVDIPEKISTKEDRIIFLKSIGQLAVRKIKNERKTKNNNCYDNDVVAANWDEYALLVCVRFLVPRKWRN